MSGTQILAVALVSVPTMLAVLLGILINNSRLSDLRAHMDYRFDEMDRHFNDMIASWRSGLSR